MAGRAGTTYLLEIKAKKGKLTPDQEKFFGMWRGHATVVRTPNEALQACRLALISSLHSLACKLKSRPASRQP